MHLFSTPVVIEELSHSDVPIRYLFAILGPTLLEVDFHELGRSMATLLADQVTSDTYSQPNRGKVER